MSQLLLTEDEVLSLVGIGFCQPKFYKAKVWRRAKRLMDTVVCANSLARPFDFGRGKGKYTTELEIDEVKQRTVKILAKANQIIES